MPALPRPGSRRRGLRRNVRPLLAAAVAFTVVIGPVPAATADHVYPQGFHAGPLDAPLPGAPSDESRFVTLWDTRFRSGAAFQAYLDSDQAYDDGYDERSPEEKAALVRALVNHWRATDPAFAEHVDWTPEPTEPGTPVGPRPTVTQVLATVNAIIFHKEEFKQSLKAPDEGTGTQAPSGTPQPPQDTSAADPLAEQAAAALAGAADAGAAMAALDGLAGNPEQVLAPVDSQLREAPRPDALDRLPTAGDVAGVDLDLADQLANVTRRLPALNVPEDVRATLPSVTASSAIGPENLVYGVCWQLPSAPESCTSNVYVVGLLTQLPGQSASIDVDNNLLTGQLGVDLEIGLVIDPLTTPGGLGATVTVKRYGTAAQNAKGVVRYLLPDSDKEVRVGFDGRTVTLQGQQSAVVVFEDVLAMSNGDVRIRASVSHSGAAGVPTVALVTDVDSALTNDALTSTMSIVRAPATLTARLVLKRTGTTGLVRVEAGHGATALPDVGVQVAARLGSAQVTGGVTLTGVPGSTIVTAITDDASNTTNVTYDATAQLARIQAGVVMVPNVASTTRYTAALDVARVPTWMTLSVQHGQVVYDANAAVGTGTGLALQATLEEHVANVLNRRAYLGLSNVPTHVASTRTASTQRFVIDAGAGIGRIDAAYYDRVSRLTANVGVTGFPGHAELTMPTSSDPRIAWTASAPTTSVSVGAILGVWSAGLTVTNVPMSMSIVPGTTNLDVNATGGAAATVNAYLTNHGVWVASPFAGDNYATATWRKLATPRVVAGGTITVEVSAALRVQGITRIRVTPGTSTAFELRAGGGAPLYLLVRIEDVPANRRGHADARIVNFPGVITGSIGAVTTLAASTNADLTAYVEYGPIASRPALPTVHGLFFRRTAEPAGLVYRGRVWLTGLPTSVTIASGSVVLGGLRPSQSTLVVDIALLDNPAAPTTAYASLSGIPTGVPHTITLTWSTAQVTGGYQTRVKATTSGATFGALVVDVGYARYAARLTTTSLPASMEGVLTEAEGSTSFTWLASAPLVKLTASLLARATATASWSGRAAVTLTDLPQSFTITTGRDAGGAGPLVTYTSSGAGGQLDADITADGSLKTSNTSVNANLYFRLVNLAPTVTVSRAGNGFALGGSGRTGLIEARVSARATYTKSGNGVISQGGWVQYPWSYQVEVTPVLKNLWVSIVNVGSFTVDPALVSRISGDYGTFGIGWDSLVVDVRAQGQLRARLNLSVCNCEFTVFSASLSTAFGINPTVRIYHDAWQTIFSARVNLWCAHLDFGLRSRPVPGATTTFTAGINLTGSPGSTRTNWVTPVLFGWVRLSDIVTGVSVYGGGFLDGWWDWDWTCW